MWMWRGRGWAGQGQASGQREGWISAYYLSQKGTRQQWLHSAPLLAHPRGGASLAGGSGFAEHSGEVG